MHLQFPSSPNLPLVRITQQPLSAQGKSHFPALSRLSPHHPLRFLGIPCLTALRLRVDQGAVNPGCAIPAEAVRMRRCAGQGSAHKMAAAVTCRLLGRGGAVVLSLPRGARCFGMHASLAGEKVTHTGQVTAVARWALSTSGPAIQSPVPSEVPGPRPPVGQPSPSDSPAPRLPGPESLWFPGPASPRPSVSPVRLVPWPRVPQALGQPNPSDSPPPRPSGPESLWLPVPVFAAPQARRRPLASCVPSCLGLALAARPHTMGPWRWSWSLRVGPPRSDDSPAPRLTLYLPWVEPARCRAVLVMPVVSSGLLHSY